MKKLMIAVSVAFCATVGFSDVTSANIVGYQNKPMGDAVEVYGCNVGMALQPLDGKDIVVSDSIGGRDLVLDDKITVLNCNYDMYDIYDVTFEGLQITSFTWDGTVQKMIDSFTIPKTAGFTFIPCDPEEPFAWSGQVAASGSHTQTFQYKYDEETEEEEFMFVLQNPFPIDTTLADIAAWATGADDKVKVYDPTYDMETIWDSTFEGWQKTSFTWDGTDQVIIDPADYAKTVVIPAGYFGNFTPGDTEKVYTWTVTLNY